MSKTLFRKEAIEAKSNRFESNSKMVSSVGFLTYLLFIASVAISVVLFVFVGRYSPKDTVQGYVTTTVGDVEVYSQSDGTILALNVTEGDLVVAGQELMTLSTSRAIGQSASIRKEIIAALRSELSDLIIQTQRENDAFGLQVRGVNEVIASLRNRLTMLTRQRDVLGIGLQLSARELTRLTALDAAELVSRKDQDHARVATVEFELRMHELDLSIDTIQSEIRHNQQLLREIPVRRDARAAEMRARAHRLSIEIAEGMGRDEQRVLAPSTGVVSGLLVREGQTVTMNNPLLNIVPEYGEFYIELLIPTRTIAFIQPGALVKIRFDAYPYQKFGTYDGVVASISRTTVFPSDKRFRVKITEPVYLATVQIRSQTVSAYGKRRGLQSGMTLTADILRDERRLIEWLFDPLISAAQKL